MAGVEAGVERGLAAAAAGSGSWSLLDSGEFWMLLAAQSMAVGTVMVRWAQRVVAVVVIVGRSAACNEHERCTSTLLPASTSLLPMVAYDVP